MEKKVLIMTFEHDSVAYQAFSELKQLHVDQKIVGEQMAVVLNDEDKRLEVKEFLDFTGRNKTAKGSMIGMLIGILGGPLGVLLGWFSGSLIGATGDAREVKDAMSIFDQTLSLITPGKNGLIAIATEETTHVIDDLIYDELNGRVVRMDAEYVMEEVKRAQETERELEKDAHHRWFNKKD